MRKVFLAGVVTIALLVAGSVATLVALTREDRARPGRAAPEAAPGGAPAGEENGAPDAPPPGNPISGFAPPPAQPTPPPAAAAARAPPPPAGSWEAVPITARARSLGRQGGLIQARLNDLQDDLRTCFQADVQVRHAGTAVSVVKDAQPMDDAGTLVLVLQLEGQDGSVRVVDAPVETRGGAGDELIACAQDFLRGRVLDVPGTKPGTRTRLLFPLMP